jgi:hypothetical protein
MRTRSTSRRSSTSRRKLIWARTLSPFAGTAIAANTAGTFGLLTAFQTALGADVLGCTVMRIRGHVSVLNQVGSHHDVDLTWGIAVAPTGTPAVQLDPELVPHYDWMQWENLQMTAENGLATDFAYIKSTVDVRSRRRMQELSQDLIFAYKNMHTVDAHTLHVGLSVLLALP